ncbi:MAG: hypothetical protein WDM78_13725 [Puia sp.]
MLRSTILHRVFQLINNVQVASLLTMTSGNINLNGNTLTLGLTAVNNGTLSWTSGTMINTGSFVRWFKTGTTITAGVTGRTVSHGNGCRLQATLYFRTIDRTNDWRVHCGKLHRCYNEYRRFNFRSAKYHFRSQRLKLGPLRRRGLVGGQYNMQIQGTDYGLIGAVSDLRLNLINSVVANAGANAGHNCQSRRKSYGSYGG